jgi:hypothetical protein
LSLFAAEGKGIGTLSFSFWLWLETLREGLGMRHEREFRINEADTVPHPGLETAIFWFLALLFSLLFWFGVARRVLE